MQKNESLTFYFRTGRMSKYEDMKDKYNIMEHNKMRKRPFEVPEGYFGSLEARLNAIPQSQTETCEGTVSKWYFRPYPALAACVAVAVLVIAVLFGTGRHNESMDPISVTYEQLLYADLIPLTNPYAIYENSTPSDTEDLSTRDDIINSLVHEGVPVETIKYEKEHN